LLVVVAEENLVVVAVLVDIKRAQLQ